MDPLGILYAAMEAEETSLDDILDELDREFGRREEERKKKTEGSPVYVNVYDMVCAIMRHVRT